MLLIAEFVIIFILIVILIVLITEETKIKKSNIPTGAVEKYWSGEERRRARRINTSLIVKYSVEKKYHIKLDGHMRNVSIGGIQLLVNEKLSKGMPLLLEFDLPQLKNAISAEGKVVWSDGKFTQRDEIGRRTFQAGIQFVNMKFDDKNKLLAYIEKNSEKEAATT